MINIDVQRNEERERYEITITKGDKLVAAYVSDNLKEKLNDEEYLSLVMTYAINACERFYEDG